MIEILLVVAACGISAVVGYLFGSPTVVEAERHEHKHVSAETKRMSISGVSGGGASNGRVNIENIDAETVEQYE